jgi:hypothetical protein
MAVVAVFFLSSLYGTRNGKLRWEHLAPSQEQILVTSWPRHCLHAWSGHANHVWFAPNSSKGSYSLRLKISDSTFFMDTSI